MQVLSYFWAVVQKISQTKVATNTKQIADDVYTAICTARKNYFFFISHDLPFTKSVFLRMLPPEYV
tara:strand:- start:326 stop:523 length:198 start_codon:yes stop_codon:yes gene_type:complete